jgi:hypothetical protein
VASWTATGTGQGSAQAASVSGLVVAAGSPLGALYPLPADTTPATGYGSGTVGSVSTTVANPNPFPVTITSATVGSVTTTPQSSRTCAAGSVLPTTSAPIPLSPPITLAANSAPTAVTVPGALYMVSTAENGCQGASFSVRSRSPAPPPDRPVRSRLVAVLALVPLAAGLLGTPPEAAAAWGTSGAAVLTGQAARMPAASPAAPTVGVAGIYPAARTFTVTWTTARPFGGRPATGYVLTRTATLSNAAMDTGTCRGEVSDGVPGVFVPATPGAGTQTCTDSTTLNLGSVQYTVTPVHGRWVGNPSAASTPVL